MKLSFISSTMNFHVAAGREKQAGPLENVSSARDKMEDILKEHHWGRPRLPCFHGCSIGLKDGGSRSRPLIKGG